MNGPGGNNDDDNDDKGTNGPRDGALSAPRLKRMRFMDNVTVCQSPANEEELLTKKAWVQDVSKVMPTQVGNWIAKHIANAVSRSKDKMFFMH